MFDTKKIVGLLTFLMLTPFIWAQGSFSVQVSKDSVLFGNYIEVTFIVENLSGEFEAPKFNMFNQLGGASHSSSISIINGQMNQTQSYRFLVEPLEEGLVVIEPAFLHTSGDVILTDPVEIIVLPNPEGIIENPSNIRRSPAFPPREDRISTPKSKRPITKL